MSGCRRRGCFWRRWAGAAWLLVLLVAAPTASSGWPASPQRIVSINLCSDLLLIDLVAPDRIAALSFLATDPDLSPYALRARAYPRVYGAADEIVALEPDLVVAQEHSARITVALLREIGIPVLDMPVAQTLRETREQIRMLAAALGEEERGRALMASLDEGLAALRKLAPALRPTALVYQANGYTVGAPSLIDDVLTAAGFRNLADATGRFRNGRLPLERLLAADPDYLIIETARSDARSLADALLDHPALTHAFVPEQILRLPSDLWTCGGVFTLDAARRLAAWRMNAEAEPRP